MENKFFQIHMPKTGGTSLETYAKRNNIDWITGGHISPQSPKNVEISKNRITIATLRCPIRHTISMYTCNFRDGNYTEGDYNDFKWIAIKHENFSSWLRAPEAPIMKAYNKEIDWATYSRFFSGKDSRASNNMFKIDYILDTSFLTEQFNERVVKKYNLPEFTLKENVSEPVEISKEDIDFIKQHRADDFVLCRQMGIKIFDGR